MLTRSYRPVELELRSDGRTVVGIAVPFDSPAEIHDRTGSFTEVFRHGAFTRTIAERGPSRVKLLAQHDMGKLPLGRATVLREERSGLMIEGRISNTRAGDEALELVRDGVLDSFSVGFTLPSGGERINRATGVREIVEAKLLEVSLVPFPAYEGASVLGLRSAEQYDPELDPELLLRRMALPLARKASR